MVNQAALDSNTAIALFSGIKKAFDFIYAFKRFLILNSII